jgi:chromosome segregation ATPase
MPNTDDILIDRMIASLREVQNLKDKPRVLKIEISGLETKRDAVKRELEEVRRQLNDPKLQKQRSEQELKLLKDIKDREAQLAVLVDRVAKQRCQLDALQALCKQQLDHHDALLNSIDSLRKRVGLAADPRPTISEPSGVTLTPEERTWQYIQEHTKRIEARQGNGAVQQ